MLKEKHTVFERKEKQKIVETKMNRSTWLTISISIGMFLMLSQCDSAEGQFISSYGIYGGLQGAYHSALKAISAISPSWFQHPDHYPYYLGTFL